MKMKNLLLSVLLILLAPGLAADFVRLVPPAPDSNDSIEVRMGGSWQNGCVPRDPVVSIAGREITITLTAGTKDCTAVITAWRANATFGPLEPGFYTVNVFLPLDNDPAPSLWRSVKFPVTEADVEYQILPGAGEVGGGYEITILGPFGECAATPCPLPEVSFDGVAGQVRDVPLGVAVVVPPHAEGTADLELKGRDGTVIETIEAGFYYYAPSAFPDPAAFKPVLFPVFFEGPGAHGSEWTSDAWVFNRGEAAVTPRNAGTVLFCAPPGEDCRTSFAPRDTLRLEHGPDSPDLGLLIHVPRAQAEGLDYSLHIRDLSRQAESAGTEIPVVSEEELKEDILQLLNVPVEDRFRQTLRVYSFDEDDGVRLQVQALPMTGESVSLGLVVLTLERGCDDESCIPFEAASAVLNDFRAAFPDIGDVDRIRLEIRPIDEALRLWGFVSVTNNDTQQVTTVTPQ